MIVKVQPVQVIHANGSERTRTEYGLHIDLVDERRFKSRKQAERAAAVIEKAIRKALEQ